MLLPSPTPTLLRHPINHRIQARQKALGEAGAGPQGYAKAVAEYAADVIPQVMQLRPSEVGLGYRKEGDLARAAHALTHPRTAPLPGQVWKQLGPQLYFTFWSLSLADLTVPNESYAATVVKQREAIVGKPILAPPPPRLRLTRWYAG